MRGQRAAALNARASSPLEFWTGMLQIAGAGIAAGLFVWPGLPAATLGAALITRLISLTSIILRRRKPPHVFVCEILVNRGQSAG